MSIPQEIKRITAPEIRARKGGEPIVCLTSYHAHTARLVDDRTFEIEFLGAGVQAFAVTFG